VRSTAYACRALTGQQKKDCLTDNHVKHALKQHKNLDWGRPMPTTKIKASMHQIEFQ